MTLGIPLNMTLGVTIKLRLEQKKKKKIITMSLQKSVITGITLQPQINQFRRKETIDSWLKILKHILEQSHA